MTAPVDIAAAVELARDLVASDDAPLEFDKNMTALDGMHYYARLFLALADERRDIEQRTAEAIAEALEASPTYPCDVCEFAASSSDRAHTKRAIAAWARAGRWRTP